MSEWKEKARAGDVGAMFRLGRCYYNGGGGVKKDYGEALVWWGKAAAKGESTALHNLGWMHENGQGTPVNLLNALNYYKQAKENGFPTTATIARVEAIIATNPALRAAAAAAAAAGTAAAAAGTAAGGSSTGAVADKQHPAKKARLEEKIAEEQSTRLSRERAALDTDGTAPDAVNTRMQQREDAVKKREAQAKQKETALERRETLVQTRETAVTQREAELESLQREQEAKQRAKEDAAAAFTAAKRAAAAARQAEVLGERRTESKKYTAQRDGIASAWARTAVDVLHCQPCSRPIAPGQSVLLDQCLHAICRACVPYMLQPDNKIVCPVCQVVSTLTPTALSHHPLVEAELGTDDAQTCIMCAPLPEEDRMPATVTCSTCEPHKALCDGHGLNHRSRQPTHVMTSLRHGGAAPRCPTHDQPIAAYCTSCDVLVCLACTLSTHPTATHEVKLLTDTVFVESVRARLVESVGFSRSVAHALIDHAADATVAAAELVERDAVIAAEVDRAVNVLVGILERRRTTMHERCASQSREERAALQTAREESEYSWRMLTSAADLAEQLATGTRLGPNATAVMMQLQSAAMARLGTAAGLKPRDVAAPTILRFHFDELVAEQLAELGEIVQDAP